MKNCLISFFIFLPLIFFGQGQKRIDSLKIELSKNLDNKIKLEVLIEIFNSYLFIDLDSAKVYKNKIIALPNKSEKDLTNAYNLSSRYYYYSSQFDSALFFTRKSLQKALKLDDNKLKSDLYRKMAILSSRNFDNENAEKYGKLALEAANKTKEWHLIASSNIMLGNQFYKKTNFNLSLKYYLVADSLYTLNKEEDRFLANSYDNIGSIYTDLKDKKALIYIEKSNKIYQRLNDKEGLGYNYILKGIYFNLIDEHKQAISNFENAINFYQGYGDLFRLNDAQTRLINSYSAIGDYEKAEAVIKDIEENLINLENREGFVSFYLNIGQLYLDTKKYEKAIDFFNKAYAIVSKNEKDFFIAYNKEIKKGLTSAYIGKKDYKNALKYSQLYLQINDSIYKKNNIAVTKELETKYQTEKKEQEIILLKSQNELVEQQKINQRNQLLGVTALASFAGLFFFFLYHNRQKTTKKLQELDKAKSTFFANISHEFRTPLTMISGPLQSQLQKGDLNEEDKSTFKMMHRNSTRLLSLVDQLLAISKIEAGNLQLKVSKNNVIPFIGTLADGFTYKARQKEIDYKIYNNPTEIDTYFDSDIIEKIIVNILSNAIKYTPQKGSIVCSTTVKNDELYFTVKNTGEGLSKEDISNIFERFYQIDKNTQGVGIGLALVKELVTIHKGFISAESSPNAWTTFKAIIPIGEKSFAKNEFGSQKINTIPKQDIITKQNYNTIENENDVEEKEENPILLIVDDNADIRAYVSNLFKNTYSILKAKNGQEGITLGIEYVPDIIISDVMMPVKNGIDLCNTLKFDERTSHIPIIILTAKAGEENEIEGVKTGADDYITKPFNEELLKIRVQKLTESRKKLQQRYSQEVILKPKDIAITSIDELFLKRIQIVLDNELIESSFNIKEFSKAVGMSRMQLHRKLKALTGLSATEFIRSQRLKLAAQLLKTSEINVSQVGYSVGFNDHAYFSKCFKDSYHCTPTEYIKKN